MFSDRDCNTLPCDIPPFDAQPDEDPLVPLDFDDLLDIAREFEFTQTITHIWPCEESGPCSETGLDDVFAAIMPAPSPDECPLPPPIPLDDVQLQEADVQSGVSVDEIAAPSTSTPSVSLPNDDDQVRSEAGCPITSILRGWSPPSGSQFLDLDDSFMLPESDGWLSPWLTPLLSPSRIQSVESPNQAPAKVQGIDDPPSATEPRAEPTSVNDMAVDDPRQKTVPPVGAPTLRVHPEPVQDMSNLPAIPHQTATFHTKTTKHRVRLPSALDTGGPSAAKYAKAPRGGVPPHIARTVTKAHFLRMEKERKVMQDAFSSTNTGEGKKPSVLRKVIRAENVGAERRRKSAIDLQNENEKQGRIKRVKV